MKLLKEEHHKIEEQLRELQQKNRLMQGAIEEKNTQVEKSAIIEKFYE